MNEMSETIPTSNLAFGNHGNLKILLAGSLIRQNHKKLPFII